MHWLYIVQRRNTRRFLRNFIQCVAYLNFSFHQAYELVKKIAVFIKLSSIISEKCMGWTIYLQSFVVLARFELARPLLNNRFSYHTCFYTSKLSAFCYAIHFIGTGVWHLFSKSLWSGLFYYHIKNLASKYIRFNLTFNSSLHYLYLRILPI